MKNLTLGYRSELIFTGFDGQVDDRGDYLVMRTLTNPNYFWGNLLIFDRPPEEGDAERWRALFHKEFPDPRIYHVTLAWNSPTGEIGAVDQFKSLDFKHEDKVVLSASRLVKPRYFNPALEVRTFDSEAQWEEMIEVETLSADDHLPPAEWEKFYRAQAKRFWAMQVAGLGHWYGGYLDGKLVCGLGLFYREGLGRYQSVVTHPDFRRRGLCGTLVYETGRRALEKTSARELVMCADPGYHAIKIYEAVGFKREVTEHGVCWWDKSRAASR